MKECQKLMMVGCYDILSRHCRLPLPFITDLLRRLILNTLLKNIKGSDVLDFDSRLLFSEQDSANHFLLISSFGLNTVKFQNRQNNLYFTKVVWAVPLEAIYRYTKQAFQRIGGVIVSSRPPLSLDLTRI